MLSTDKPVASTWLDRLRLNRGISTTDDEDASGHPLSLDDFLLRNHHTEITGDPATSSASDSPPSAPIPPDPLESGTGEWYGVMSDVLSELFNFDGSTQSSTNLGKKFPRKQSKPRHCSVEIPKDVPLLNQRSVPNFVSKVGEFANSKKRGPERRERKRIVTEGDGVDDEETEEENDLIRFSRSEVTVIDTSFSIWKSEKLVFRRKNVWKVKDKKGKSHIVSSKKKKKKKIKKIKKKKRKCELGDGEISRKSKKMKIVSRSDPDNNPRRHNDDPESSNVNRILLSRLPSKLRKEGSFGIHTSKKNTEPEASSHRS